MSITRDFKVYLNAGVTVAPVIHVNQYDQGETWVFTLYTDRGIKYTPSSGAICGIKSDGMGIINTAEVNEDGQVVVEETQQMTAAAGKAIYSLMIDDDTHYTANFIVMVEQSPLYTAIVSDSDLSLIQEALNSVTPAVIAEEVSDWLDDNITQPTTPVVDASLTVQGAAADAKATGDAITDLNDAIAIVDAGTVKDSIKEALMALADAVVYKNSTVGNTVKTDLYHALYDAEVISITAVFNAGNEFIYDTDSLDTLKQYLTVTALYDDNTTGTVSGYTLSGTLSVGTSTITVTYMEKTTTFSVAVRAGVPSGYTHYDYVYCPTKTTGLPRAAFILLDTYSNVDALSWDIKFLINTGYDHSTTLLGSRAGDANTTSTTIYVGTTSSHSVGQSNKLRMIARGNDQAFSTNEMLLDQVNRLIFNNTASSPSSYTLNGVETTLEWGATQYIVSDPIGLFLNVKSATTTGLVVNKDRQIGNLRLFNLSGTCVGDYVPVKRNSDNVIGMFDRVTQAFFTSATASYSTIGNPNCLYALGNWS